MLFFKIKSKSYSKQAGVILGVFGKMLLKLEKLQAKMNKSIEANKARLKKIEDENKSIEVQIQETGQVMKQLEKFKISKKEE